MKIILVEPDERLRDLFELNLAKELNAEVIPREGSEEAIGFLQLLPDARMVVTKDRIGKQNTAQDIADFLVNTGRTSIQLFSIGSEVNDQLEFIHKLSENTKPEELVSQIKKKKKVKGQSIIIEGHVPVPLTSLKYLSHFPCDIFIRLTKDGEYKFVKRFNREETILLTEIKTFVEKGVEKVYVKEENFEKFVSQSNIIFNSILEDPGIDKKSKEEIRQVVLRQIKSIGVNEQSVDLAQSVLNDVTSEINSKENLEVISSVFNSSLGYPFQRSYMTSVIAQLILDQYDWKEKGHTQALTMASIFCDSELSSKLEAEIVTDDQLLDSGLSKERRDFVKNHASLAAKKLTEIKNLSPLVEQIVIGHHGNKNGESFNFNLIDNLNSVIAIFIVADNFSRLLLNSPRKKINAAAYLKEIRELYPSEQIGDCLEKVKLILSSR